MRYAIIENNRVVKIMDLAEDYVFTTGPLVIPSAMANLGDYYDNGVFIDHNFIRKHLPETVTNIKKRYHDVGKARRNRQFAKMSLQEQVKELYLEK